MADWTTVKKDFIEDWQFILATGRLPFFKPFALLVVAAPLVTGTSKEVPIESLAFVPLWIAGLLSMIAVAITFYYCPRFIRQYENFSAYAAFGHSHRFILWEFYNLRDGYSKKEDVVKEVIDKKLARKANAKEIKKYPLMADQYENGFFVGGPQIVGRDIELRLLQNNRLYIVAFREADEALEKRIKELFWIIYSDLTKSGARARRTIWTIFSWLVVLFIIAVVLGVLLFSWQRIWPSHHVQLPCSAQLIADCAFA